MLSRQREFCSEGVNGEALASGLAVLVGEAGARSQSEQDPPQKFPFHDSLSQTMCGINFCTLSIISSCFFLRLFQNYLVTLQLHIVCRSPIWARGRDADIVKSVYLAQSLTHRNLANSIVSVRNVAAVDVSGMKYYRDCHIASSS